MRKVMYLRNKVDEGFKMYRTNMISVYCGRITKLEIEKLSEWYIVERESLGYVKFTKKEDSR